MFLVVAVCMLASAAALAAPAAGCGTALPGSATHMCCFGA
jgi:hypothetical protein